MCQLPTWTSTLATYLVVYHRNAAITTTLDFIEALIRIERAEQVCWRLSFWICQYSAKRVTTLWWLSHILRSQTQEEVNKLESLKHLAYFIHTFFNLILECCCSVVGGSADDVKVFDACKWLDQLIMSWSVQSWCWKKDKKVTEDVWMPTRRPTG